MLTILTSRYYLEHPRHACFQICALSVESWLPSAQCHPTCTAGKGNGRKGREMTTCSTMLSSCLRAKEGNDFDLGQNYSITLSGNCLIPLCSYWPMSLTISFQCPFYRLSYRKHSWNLELFGQMCWVAIFVCVCVWYGIFHLEGWLAPTSLFIQSEWWWPA